ncbi:hypothetical protein ES708_06658 [subsurface metagenome]
MAVIKKGEHIQDIRGGSKNHVYSDWRGRGYVRSKAINPSNPRSSAQAALRSSMPRYSHLWSKTLTEAQRALWNEYAQSEGKIKGSRSMARQIIPPPGVIGSGFNMFVRNNILLQTAGLQVPPAYLATPPTPADPASSSPLDLEAVWNYGVGQVFFEDFLDEVNGAKPNAWTPPWTYVDGAGPSQITATNTAAPLWPLACLFNNAGNPRSQALFPLPSLKVEGSIYEAYAVANQNNASQSVLFTVDFPITNACSFVGFHSTARFQYIDGGVTKFFGAYNASQVYRFRVVHHLPALTYDIYVDNMVIPKVAGVSFSAAFGPAQLYLFQDVTLGTYFINFYRVVGSVPLGLDLSWTDPVNAPVGSRIRAWLRSYGMSAHLQQVDTVALGEEELILSQIRTAQGRTVDISNLPGEYKLQLDSVSPGGRQSAPSNVIEVTVPST